MENCLVTKLKGIVNNDSLPFFERVKLDVSNASGNASERKLRLAFNTTGQEIRAIGGVHFTDSSLSQDLGNVVSSGVGYGITTWVSVGKGSVTIPKYTLREINVIYQTTPTDRTPNFSINSDEVDACELLSTFVLPGGTIYGDLNGFKSCPLTQFNVNYGVVDVNASFDFLRENTTLQYFQFAGVNLGTRTLNIATYFSNKLSIVVIDSTSTSAVSGSLESLCEAQCGAGRTSGTLIVRGGIVTMNNESDGLSAVYTITFSASGCTISSTSGRIATYSGGVWTYSE